MNIWFPIPQTWQGAVAVIFGWPLWLLLIWWLS